MKEIKTNHIIVSSLTYFDYIKEHNTDKLDTFLKIYTYKKFREKILLESFDKSYKDTIFYTKNVVFDEKVSNYKNRNGYQIFFKTNSDTEYRIDLAPVINFNKKIDSNFVWNISFTTSDKEITDINYEKPTNLNEQKEVLFRIGDILNQMNIPKFFVIGNTENIKRITIYEGFLLIVFPDHNIEMSYCEGFLEDKGLYIWLKLK